MIIFRILERVMIMTLNFTSTFTLILNIK